MFVASGKHVFFRTLASLDAKNTNLVVRLYKCLGRESVCERERVRVLFYSPSLDTFAQWSIIEC